MSGRPDFYQDKAGEWRWRIVALNGRVLADSGEGYNRRDDCEAGSRLRWVLMRLLVS